MTDSNLETKVLDVQDEGDVRYVTIEARRKKAGDDWEWTKDEIEEQERRSRKLWDELDDEKRQACLVLCRDSLLRLVEDPGAWVPISLEPRSDERVDLLISISLTEIDDEVLKRRLVTERKVKDATADLVNLHDELRSDNDEARPEAA